MANRFQRTIRDGAGNVAAAVAVTVTDPVSGNPVTIYSDEALTSVKANPGVTDANGRFDFWAADTVNLVDVTAGEGVSAYTLQDVLIGVPQLQPYPNRAAAVAANIPAPVVAFSVIGPAGKLLFYKEDSATDYPALTNTPSGRKFVPAGTSSIDHFGAIPYSSQAAAEAGLDSAAAMQAAVNYQAEVRGGLIYASGGTYRLTSVVTINTRSVGFFGVGMNTTTFLVDQVAGAGLRFQMDNPRLENCQVTSSTTRQAAVSNAALPGVQIEIEDIVDSTTRRTRWIHFQNVRVSGHPGSGITGVGPTTGVFLTCDITTNKLHGYHFTDQVVERTFPTGTGGLVEIISGHINNNGGHAIFSSSETAQSSPAVRVGARNVEIGGNATDTDVRLWPAEVYYRGAQFEMNMCVLKPVTTGIEGFCVSGVGLRLLNNRYLNCVRAGTITSHSTLTTQDVIVSGIQMSDNSQGAFDPLVLVRKETDAEEPTGIVVEKYWGGTVTRRIATDSTMGNTGEQRVPGLDGNRGLLLLPKVGDLTVNNTISLTNINDLAVWMEANETIFFEVVLNYSTSATADLRYNYSIPTSAVVTWTTENGMKYGTDSLWSSQDVLTGAGTNLVIGGNGQNRLIKIVGSCVNGATAGYLMPRFAQGTAEVSDTIIRGALTHIKVWRNLK